MFQKESKAKGYSTLFWGLCQFSCNKQTKRHERSARRGGHAKSTAEALATCSVDSFPGVSRKGRLHFAMVSCPRPGEVWVPSARGLVDRSKCTLCRSLQFVFWAWDGITNWLVSSVKLPESAISRVPTPLRWIGLQSQFAPEICCKVAGSLDLHPLKRAFWRERIPRRKYSVGQKPKRPGKGHLIGMIVFWPNLQGCAIFYSWYFTIVQLLPFSSSIYQCSIYSWRDSGWFKISSFVRRPVMTSANEFSSWRKTKGLL